MMNLAYLRKVTRTDLSYSMRLRRGLLLEAVGPIGGPYLKEIHHLNRNFFDLWQQTVLSRFFSDIEIKIMDTLWLNHTQLPPGRFGINQYVKKKRSSRQSINWSKKPAMPKEKLFHDVKERLGGQLGRSTFQYALEKLVKSDIILIDDYRKKGMTHYCYLNPSLVPSRGNIGELWKEIISLFYPLEKSRSYWYNYYYCLLEYEIFISDKIVFRDKPGTKEHITHLLALRQAIIKIEEEYYNKSNTYKESVEKFLNQLEPNEKIDDKE